MFRISLRIEDERNGESQDEHSQQGSEATNHLKISVSNFKGKLLLETPSISGCIKHILSLHPTTKSLDFILIEIF